MNGPFTILVPPQSAMHCRPLENGQDNTFPINRAHSEMVKFGLEDDVYEKVVERVKTMAQRAPSNVKSI